jgi:stress response protein YsnF
MSDNTSMSRSEYVTAFFDSEAEAEAAIARIEAEGVPRDQIRMVAGGLEAGTVAAEPQSKGFFGMLEELFMPDEDRYAYAEGLSRGGFLVTVGTTSANRDRILDILDDEGTVDMDAREESWRSEGWAGYQTTSEVAPQRSAAAATSTDTDAPIEVVEESLRVGKRDVERGRVRVRSYVVETPIEEEVSLRSETVHLERKAVDRPVGASEAFVDRTIEATETAEEAVISKEARVTEEISLDKVVDARTETVRDTVRRTEVEIEDERDDLKK